MTYHFSNLPHYIDTFYKLYIYLTRQITLSHKTRIYYTNANIKCIAIHQLHDIKRTCMYELFQSLSHISLSFTGSSVILGSCQFSLICNNVIISIHPIIKLP